MRSPMVLQVMAKETQEFGWPNRLQRLLDSYGLKLFIDV